MTLLGRGLCVTSVTVVHYWFGYVPNLVNSMERHVKQRIETGRFRAAQPSVQISFMDWARPKIP